MLVVSSSGGGQAASGPKVTKKVWFDITIGGEPCREEAVIGLFVTLFPRQLITSLRLQRSQRVEGYKGSKFHRVIPEFDPRR